MPLRAQVALLTWPAIYMEHYTPAKNAVRNEGLGGVILMNVAGTAASLGEEYVFLADALAAGLAGVHDPLPVSVHPHESSGFVWEGEAQARARALVFSRVFGRAAPLVRLAFAAKNARRFARWRDALAFLRG